MGKSSKRRRRAGLLGPCSGQILGAVVDALDVGEGVLADRTAKRMFAGRSVSEHSRKERLVALAQVLVDLGIVPDADDRLRGGEFRDGLTTADIVGDVIGAACQVWDRLMEHAQNHSAPVADFSGAGRRYLRLATVDVALRMVGFARFARVELPEPNLPLWAQPKGAGETLRGLQRELGVTRDQLAARLEVPPTTLDNWLDSTVIPGRNHVPVLARGLWRRGSVDAEDLGRDLTRQFALARLAETVAAVVGWEAVGEDVRTAFHLARLMQEMDGLSSEIDGLTDFAGLEREPAGYSASSNLVEHVVPLLLLTIGSFAPFAPGLLRPLAGRWDLRGWSEDLRAAVLPPEIRVQFIAGRHSGGRAAAGLAQDYFDVVGEPSAEDIEAAEAIRRAKEQEAHEMLSVAAAVDQVERPLVYFQRGIDFGRRFVRQFPNSAEAHYQLGSLSGQIGMTLGDRGLIDEGIMECKVAAGLEPRWDAPAVEPGIILANLEDWEGALRELESAANSLLDKTPHLRNVRGYVLMNAGRLEEALADYLEVVGARPDFGSAWGNAAHCAFGLGNRTAGLQYAKRAHALGDPSAYDAWDKGAYGPRRKRNANLLQHSPGWQIQASARDCPAGAPRAPSVVERRQSLGVVGQSSSAARDSS